MAISTSNKTSNMASSGAKPSSAAKSGVGNTSSARPSGGKTGSTAGRAPGASAAAAKANANSAAGKNTAPKSSTTQATASKNASTASKIAANNAKINAGFNKVNNDLKRSGIAPVGGNTKPAPGGYSTANKAPAAPKSSLGTGFIRSAASGVTAPKSSTTQAARTVAPASAPKAGITAPRSSTTQAAATAATKKPLGIVKAGGSFVNPKGVPANVAKALADRGYNPDGTKMSPTQKQANIYKNYQQPPGVQKPATAKPGVNPKKYSYPVGPTFLSPEGNIPWTRPVAPKPPTAGRSVVNPLRPNDAPNKYSYPIGPQRLSDEGNIPWARPEPKYPAPIGPQKPNVAANKYAYPIGPTMLSPEGNIPWARPIAPGAPGNSFIDRILSGEAPAPMPMRPGFQFGNPQGNIPGLTFDGGQMKYPAPIGPQRPDQAVGQNGQFQKEITDRLPQQAPVPALPAATGEAGIAPPKAPFRNGAASELPPGYADRYLNQAPAYPGADGITSNDIGGTFDNGAGQGQQGATYAVQRGDTLGKIAAKNGTTVQALAEANGIKNPNMIRPGQRLTIPGGATVQPMGALQSPLDRVVEGMAADAPYEAPDDPAFDSRFPSTGQTADEYMGRADPASWSDGEDSEPVSPSQGEDVPPSQLDRYPQDYDELKNRWDYSKQKLKDDVKTLPGRVVQAIRDGDFRNTFGYGNFGDVASRNPRPATPGPTVNYAPGNSDYQALVQQLLALLNAQQGILSGNKSQMDLVYNTFV